PQSTSVSIPSIIKLAQGDLPHSPFTQVRLAQSGPSLQCWPSLHLVEQDAPQSTSGSSPFLTMSEHEGAAHARLTQILLAQSLAPLRAWPGSRGAHGGPPQSWSVSSPSVKPFMQGPGATDMRRWGDGASVGSAPQPATTRTAAIKVRMTASEENPPILA